MSADDVIKAHVKALKEGRCVLRLKAKQVCNPQKSGRGERTGTTAIHVHTSRIRLEPDCTKHCAAVKDFNVRLHKIFKTLVIGGHPFIRGQQGDNKKSSGEMGITCNRDPLQLIGDK